MGYLVIDPIKDTYKRIQQPSKNGINQPFPLDFTYSNQSMLLSSISNIQGENTRWNDLRQSLCFFFEEPTDILKYKENNGSSQLDDLGPFSITRLKYMKTIHVMWDNPDGQIYVAKRLDVPHYQEIFEEFIAKIPTCKHQIGVCLYPPEIDTETDFLLSKMILSLWINIPLDWIGIL